MNDFTATNSLTVRRSMTDGFEIEYDTFPEDPTVNLYIPSIAAAAVSEFVLAERDTELGRWRDPERTSFVIYPQGEAGIVVLSEPTGISRVFSDRADVDLFRQSYLSPSAYAYFDAHPEPKPTWYEAQHDEVWLLTTPATGDRPYQVVRTEETGFRFFLISDNHGGFRPGLFPNEAQITAGRRIWPEPS